MKNWEKSKHILTCLLISIALTGCPNSYKLDIDQIDYSSPQKPAAILFGDPQVYSRASLINDRRQETGYLQQLLKNSEVDSSGKSSVTFTPQIIRDLKTVQVLSANLGLTFGIGTSNTSSVTDLKQQIDETKLQAKLAVLKKQVEGIENAEAPTVTIPSPDLTSANQTETSSGTPSGTPSETPSKVTWPDLSTLKEAITKVQEQLKSLSEDNKGPAAPGNTYAGLADPRDDFIDREAYRRDIRAALAEVRLDDVHDRGGNALYRLQFQATVLPPNGHTKQWGAAKMTIEPPQFTWKDLQIDYISWLAYVSATLNEALELDKEKPEPSIHDYNYDQYIAKIARGGFFNIIDIFQNDQNGKYYCFQHGSASESRLKEIAEKGGIKIIAEGKGEKADQGWLTKDWTYAVPASLLIKSEFKKCVMYDPGTEAIKEEKIKDSEIEKKLVGEVHAWISKYRPQKPIDEKGLQLLEDKIGPDVEIFCKALVSDQVSCTEKDKMASAPAAGASEGKDYAVQSYSVLPSELAQRIGMTTESSQSLQTALSVAATLAGKAQAGLDVGYLRESDKRAEALSRQPLVVGFAGSEPGNSYGNSYFGWLFGPQFSIIDSETLGLQQTVRRYGVNADVSLPGWWRYITLQIGSAWIKDWSGAKLFGGKEAGKSPQTVRKIVNLPLTDATYESLTNFIAAKEGNQNSRIFVDYCIPNVVPACASSVTFQIGGKNVWRADSIFLAGVRAKDISVLPDMSGVAAEFDMTNVFGSLVNAEGVVQEVPLMVSAEQGAAATLPVFVVGKRQSSNGATSCQSPLILPTRLSLLPPTVVSSSPSEICTGTKSFPLIIQGVNLPTPKDPKDFEVHSEYFNSQGIHGDKFKQVVNLIRDQNNQEKKVPSEMTPHITPIVLDYHDGQGKGDKILSVNVTIKECKAATTKPPKKAILITPSVSKAKDQKIALKVDLPVDYNEVQIWVRLHTESNDAAWLASKSIQGVPAGEAAKVEATMDLSTIKAKEKGDSLDVKVMIRPSADKDWQEINADRTLEIKGS
jgi:hypothetical protein